MSKVIAFANSKGGCGKTTMCLLTAVALRHRAGKKILVIDSDPQKSIMKMKDRGEVQNSKYFSIDFFDWDQPDAEKKFTAVIDDAEEKFDLIFIDVPGKLGGKGNFYSVLISDAVIIPIIASALDIDSTADFLKSLPQAFKRREEHDMRPIEVFGVVNKKNKTIEHRYLSELQGVSGLKLFNTYLSDNVRYKRNISASKQITTEDQIHDEFNMYYIELLHKLKI